jgi:tRNA modification GTPase
MSTIAAISTAPGVGGIAVIRVSGEEAIVKVSSIFKSKSASKSLINTSANTVIYGTIYDEANQVVDDVLAAVFHAPHSFTGEHTVEISCHGSVFIQQQILQLLVNKGCILAQPGEFTQRAFLNGKMDLSQAEAVADLIAARSKAAHRISISQMRGGFSSELTQLRTQLIDFVSLIELELDFNEEDVEFADRDQLKRLTDDIRCHIEKLTDSFSVGNALKNGIPVALVGETNVGKSTLLNLLLKEDKAIVSDIHGTTRDVIEDNMMIKGVNFRFIDTAGIRDTTDAIETIGIERTYKQIEQASIVLWVLDCTQLTEHIEWLTEKIELRAIGKKIILVFNKIDLVDKEEIEVINQMFSQYEGDRIFISAKNLRNTEQLEQSLLNASQVSSVNLDEVVVSNVRHYEALQHAHSAICRVYDGLEAGVSNDFLSQDIRECLFALGTITGQVSNDEILANIFGKFCIGK